jgi:enamine deaminase RidA (YjgF/YER057c/UK114 family)
MAIQEIYQQQFDEIYLNRKFVHILIRFEPGLQPEKQIQKAINQYFTPELSTGGILKIFCISHRFNTNRLTAEYPTVLFSQTFQKPLQNCDAAIQLMTVGGSETDCKCNNNQLLSIGAKAYRQYFLGSVTADKADSTRRAIAEILQKTEKIFSDYGITLADNVHRTWFYLDDIFGCYTDFTEARKARFKEIGLVPETHYIASTGISSHSPDNTPAIMDCVAYDSENITIEYLKAPAYLNPTIDYGVTFERGVCLSFGNCKHMYISGTASIDAEGNVLHKGDIRAQTRRVFENISALISGTGATLNQVFQAVVYIRDQDDFNAVKQEIESISPSFPAIYTQANVCRRDWLVEVECLLMVNL